MIAFIIALFYLVCPDIFAQEATSSGSLFNQYQADYIYQYNLYQQAYSKYTEKSQIYAKYKTITTQKDKISTAILAINARNLALKSYLMALRVMLNDYKSVNSTATETIQTNINHLESWLDDQPSIVLTIDDIYKLQKYSTGFQDKYIEIQQIIYTALIQNEVNLRQFTLDQIQSLADNIKNSPNFKPESQQWISTLATESDLVSTGLTKALSLTQKDQNSVRFVNFYPNSQEQLNLVQNHLIKITSDLKLIVNRFYQP